MLREIRDRYPKIGPQPREIERWRLAQTPRKRALRPQTLKSRVRYEGEMPAGEREGVTRNEDGSHTIENLLANLVAAPTNRMISEGADWLLSVFVDNSGVVAFDDDHAVCFKVETHNHPQRLSRMAVPPLESAVASATSSGRSWGQAHRRHRCLLRGRP